MDLGKGPFPVGRAVGQRYETRRLLGVGGMGAVYEAWDRELEILVALKVILPEAAGDPAAAAQLERRFKRELLLARQVTHRNVVRIHDLGEIEGIKYITMPLVAGTDLRSRLSAAGKLPLSQALGIARQVVAGLRAAHDAGVIHRDLKPANIMIDEGGQALIMDFGLARFTGPEPAESPAAHAADATTVTTAPMQSPVRQTPPLRAATDQGLVGTLEYMAPEQARGEAADERTDIYAFGLILQEMLIGRRELPPGLNRLQAMTLRLRQPATSLRQTDPAIPAPVDAIVMRCLQPEPAQRYQKTSELAAALDDIDDAGRPVRRYRKFVLVGAAVAVLGASTFWLTRDTAPPAAPRPVQMIIASFANSTGDAGLENTIEQALGLTLEGATFVSLYPRRNALAEAKQLGASSDAVTEDHARLIAISKGIDAIVTGSIARRNSGYRLTSRMIDADGKQLSERSEDAAGKAELLTAVTRLASGLRDDLGDTTPPSVRQKDIETFTTSSLEAVSAYVLAQNLAAEFKFKDAIAQYRIALKHDPEFGRAYSGLAVSAFRDSQTAEAEEAYKKAFASFDRMTERERLRTLGAYYLQFAVDFHKAAETYGELVAKFPLDRAGHSNLAIAHFGLLDFKKAMETGRLAIAAYPREATFRSNYALFAMYAGEFATAAEEGRKTIELNKASFKAYLPVAMAAIDAGDRTEATAAYDRMKATSDVGASLATAGLADLAAYEGRPAEAIPLLRAGIARDEQEKRGGNALAKKIALAEALASVGQMQDARKIALSVATLRTDAARVPAARLLGRIGATSDAARIAADLGAQLQPQSRAYGRIIEGELAMRRNDHAGAAAAFLDARKSSDLWLGRLLLGINYVLGKHAELAVSELEAAWKRRGEATALFLDDSPTYRYLPELHYWRGRAHQDIGALASARQHYEAFLRLRPESSTDPLASDARNRLAGVRK